ncbi:unnamed protein product [Trichobilharzia regenti]|nr:unnamed protein product [Trichobilharzia regenti]
MCSCAILHHVFCLFQSNSFLANDTLNYNSNNNFPSTIVKSGKLRNSQSVIPHIMKNNRIRQLYTILDKLPLPRVERRRLQRDAFAVLARGISD